ncbi:ATP adenylyltransferase family protein [Leptolyngbya sp. PCC 6406]|uniref:ATP adenylyltransferase family protein n=1 Tax=Leptolyngbya sp. PCC 6406 TaxID=1173264 RepID=UPI0002ACE361|nr:ATP adenylyltransferase (5',5'''-P-1,P-4-tetraphosphate phosphorylase II) [Leptolyngbya sp. PCC 6406]
MDSAAILTPGNLWTAAQQTTDRAIASGALQSIATDFTLLEEGGIPFLVRILTNLIRKDIAQIKARKDGATQPSNPFLPYELDLWVGHFSESHTCLLNKFNVVDHHLLIVTRHYEAQDTWLTETDFAALAIGLAGIDGLAFYNGGQAAGASQHHKHLQLVPLPIAPAGPTLPIESLVTATQVDHPVGKVFPLNVPFQAWAVGLGVNWDAGEAVIALKGNTSSSEESMARTIAPILLRHYQQLMAAIGLTLEAAIPDRPYNLLVTRRWMLAVPRTQDRYDTISVNALGYAGSLLVRNAEELKRLKAIGPLGLLTAVGHPVRGRVDN